VRPEVGAGAVTVEVGAGATYLGTAEIRVASDDGICFAAPTLIYHYVAEHGYRPPEQFVEAVLKTAAQEKFVGAG
jgi:hypothetical protein